MLDKVKCERIHAKKRLVERFNLKLNRTQLNKLIKDIQENNNNVRFYSKQSNSRTRWLVTIEEEEVIAVYDKTRKQIVTFLYPSRVPPPNDYNPYVEGSNNWKAFNKGKDYQRRVDQEWVDER